MLTSEQLNTDITGFWRGGSRDRGDRGGGRGRGAQWDIMT